MLLPYTGLWADLIEFPDGGNVIVTSGSCVFLENAARSEYNRFHRESSSS